MEIYPRTNLRCKKKEKRGKINSKIDKTIETPPLSNVRKSILDGSSIVQLKWRQFRSQHDTPLKSMNFIIVTILLLLLRVNSVVF